MRLDATLTDGDTLDNAQNDRSGVSIGNVLGILAHRARENGKLSNEMG